MPHCSPTDTGQRSVHTRISQYLDTKAQFVVHFESGSKQQIKDNRKEH